MDVIIDKGCGLDVHKETVVACVMGEGIKKEIRTFSTMAEDLFRLKSGLSDKGITHVAMESTGPYWKPVFNLLEDTFEVILANARHIKNVPGRKTDVKDSEWICKLLRSGLLAASFVPPKAIRELRDLTRYRRKLTQAISSEKNRVQKVLEDANVKISSVVSDTFGVSASRMIDALMAGNLNAESISDLAVGKLKGKKEELKKALVGNFQEHHRFMIQASLDHIESLEKIIAEIGADMDRFPSEGHLSAWAASKTKNTYLSAKYHSLVGRRGKKRALIAVGHKILIMVYYILKTGMPYKELGKDYLSRRREDKIVKGHIKRLKDLGYEVALKKAA